MGNEGPRIGKNLDVTSSAAAAADAQSGRATRPFVGVRFACCEVYSRVYVNRQHTAYVGYCPRCLKKVELMIGPGGTDARFFTAQ